jgi:hypothetical protein
MRSVIITLLALLFLAPASKSQSVTFDNSCAATDAGTAVSTISCSLTIGAITNGAVMIGLDFYRGAGNPSAITCTVGGVSAAVVTGTDTSSSTAVRSLIYALATGSTTGSQSISCSWTTATFVVIGAASFGSVNQTTPAAHGTGASITVSGPIAVTVTSATNDYTLSTATGLNNNSLSAPTQTSKWSTNEPGFEIQGAGQVATGAATVAHQWTGVGNCSISAVDVQHL